MVENAAQRGQRHLRESGYTAPKGGDIHTDARADAEMVAKGVHQHEAHMHRGEAKTKLKLKGGGKVPGHKGEARPDRRARGGSITADQPDDAQGNVGANSARARGGHVRRADGGKITPEELRASYAKSQAAGSKMSPEDRFSEATKGLKQDGPLLDRLGQKDGGEVKRARGGHVGKKGRTTVNINLGHGDQGNPAREQAAHQDGIKKGLMLGAAVHPPGPGALPTAPGGMPPHPPMGLPTGGPPMAPPGGAPMMPPRPPMAGPPVGAPPGGMPPMMHKRGGAVRRAEGGKVDDSDDAVFARAKRHADIDTEVVRPIDKGIVGAGGKRVRPEYAVQDKEDEYRRGGTVRRDAEGRFTGGSI